MQTSDFFYSLPENLIAQTPLEPRDSSRMLVANRKSGEITDSLFINLCDYLHEGDLLVFNNSKVFPARIFGKKVSTDIDTELLLLKQISQNRWECLVRPGRRLKKDSEIFISDELSAKIIETVEGGNRIVEFYFSGSFFEILERVGNMPLPPYITEKLLDNSRYNTIYSRDLGSAAAPTAGLHFTDRMFDFLREKKIDTAFLTLHVGLGTFRPVKVDDVENHIMHSEHYSVDEKTAEKINECKRKSGRIIAVGTTTVRTLESVYRDHGGIIATNGDTNIFIYPGYKFQCVDGILTNFHLPESTLIMLISAFMGKENTLSAYDHAVKEKYRFFSFGDSMLIL